MSDPRKLPQVLYIEDSDETRALVRRLLAEHYIVLETSNPLNGLQLAEETQPNLILLDHNLPQMSGSEVATRLKKLLPNTPIVIISGDTSQGARERALAAGAVGFIAKPFDSDFEKHITEYLNGKVEKLENPEGYLQAYQQELVERLEGNIRQLSSTLEKNKHLLSQNERMFTMLDRRHKLLQTAARVGQMVTSILSLDELLKHTVNIICSEFNFYYSGIFLLSEDKKFAELRAGFAQPGRKMIEAKYRLPVDEKSMIGKSILTQFAQIASNAAGEESRFKNPFLPDTKSEMALPLIVDSVPLGALTVQSNQLNAFSDDDITSLQAMSEQVAIAINNAQLMRKLESANSELLRTKTYEAIATATGEAIHWVGNKAAPIPGSVGRVKEDIKYLLALLSQVDESKLKNDSLRVALQTVKDEAQEKGLDLESILQEMSEMKVNRIKALVSVDSMIEDLEIAESSANTILEIKEGLIGPARQRHDESVLLQDMISSTVTSMGLPDGVIEMKWEDLPNVVVDARQMEQVFNNLIKNAWEALSQTSDPKIYISGKVDSNNILIKIRDNGPGIPKEIQEKIWVSFFTTKGGKGGTGLGLSAVMQIVNQHNGKIWLESEVGKGATFFVRLPIER